MAPSRSYSAGSGGGSIPPVSSCLFVPPEGTHPSWYGCPWGRRARGLAQAAQCGSVLETDGVLAPHAPPKLHLAVASKVTSTNMALEVASSALQIFGDQGLSRDYPIERLLRDARASMIEDGCNDLLSLVAAKSL
jgi:alkylation response protein AidB-like acyl-CoA dehydrogenase